LGNSPSPLLKDTEKLLDIWNLLYEVKKEYLYIVYRRIALGDLLNSIGPDNFYSGVMPPPLPIWLFREIQ